MTDINELIIADIFSKNRFFLSGKKPNDNELRQNLQLPVLIDGLDSEDAALILSTLPQGASGIYLSPLDKGLSGAKVYAAHFSRGNNTKSKVYVFKIGRISKVEAEVKAIEQFVCPYIKGVDQPIFRKGKEKALVVQEFVGLSGANLTSLRQYVRDSNKGGEVLRNLLEERFGVWYLENQQPASTLSLGSLFERYLRKGPSSFVYPDEWSELQEWVKDVTGLYLYDIESIVKKIATLSINSVRSIIHGDLHAQNILVDRMNVGWPIDFAWCRDELSPVIDLVMLECSLKFLAMPWSASLRSLLQIEANLCQEPLPNVSIGKIPHSDKIRNILFALQAVRGFAFNKLHLSFVDYRRALTIMTYSLSTHNGLNRPYVLGSLQILTALEENGG